MQTPLTIVPEWYLLPFYTILRSIPNKLLGVIAMFSAILAIMLLPITDLGRSKGFQFRSLNKLAFWVFVANFLILMKLGGCHVESPFIELGQISTVFFFSYFVIIVPALSLLENTLTDLNCLNLLTRVSLHTTRWYLSFPLLVNKVCVYPKNTNNIVGTRRSFQTTRSLRMDVDTTIHLFNLCLDHFDLANYYLDLSLKSVYTIKSAALSNGMTFNQLCWDLASEVYRGPDTNILYQAHHNFENLPTEAQVALHKGKSILTELKQAGFTQHINTADQSNIYTALCQAQGKYNEFSTKITGQMGSGI